MTRSMLLLFALVACGDEVRGGEAPTRGPLHGQVVAGAGRLRAGAITIDVEIGTSFSTVRGGR